MFAVFAAVSLAQLWAGESLRPVPPEGVTPFDPEPLMEKVAARIQTDKYRFAVIGDSKHGAGFPGLLEYLDKVLQPDFVLSTGDMVQAGGGKPGPGYWEKLAHEGNMAFRERPWWPVAGNHELAGSPSRKKSHHDDDDELDENTPDTTDGLANFKRFYNLQHEYYSFSFRNAVFIALPYPLPKDESEKWLKEELRKAAASGKHIFVFNHVPFFTVGSKTKKEVPNKENGLTRLFAKCGVCAVFSGHDHTYYRTVRSGVPYVISAGGGAKLYALARMSEALPEDVYYGVDPQSDKPWMDLVSGWTGAPKRRYFYHNGAAGWPDRLTEQPDQYAVVVDVDGPKVAMFCVTAKGEKLDEMVLAR
ncbi:MAG: metallophosphoesterase [Planctomycetota bacterium]